jgi:bacteriorhodopsin
MSFSELKPTIPSVEGVTAFGTSVLWIAFTVLGASSLIVLLSSLREHAKNRVFHHITFIILVTASISYYAMANGLSASYTPIPGTDGSTVRQVFLARYADWLVTTPLLLLDLALLAGLPVVDTGLLIVADIGMIVTGLIGAVISDSSKWFFFIISDVFFVFILYGLLIQGRKTSYLRASSVGNAYVGISLFTIVLWTAYPVVWALGEGTGIITPDLEVLTYAILDVSAKAVFGFWLLGVHAAVSEAQVAYPDSWVEGGVRLSE